MLRFHGVQITSLEGYKDHRFGQRIIVYDSGVLLRVFPLHFGTTVLSPRGRMALLGVTNETQEQTQGLGQP
jgi:hypothetical protein